MKKPIRTILIVILILFGLVKLTEWYLEIRFENLINKNPKRAYNITYKAFDLHTFFKGITLDEVKITPLNKTKGTIVNGTVEYAELRGFVWRKFLFGKTLKVDELQFTSPVFRVNLILDSTKTKKVKKKSGNSLQTLFSDILSRVDLEQFEIREGSIIINENDSILKGKVHKINILAEQIETDSMQLTNIIPFQLGNLEVDIDSMFYQINDFTKAKLGSIDYSIADEQFKLKDVSLQYDKDWVAISRERGIQDDVIEFKLETLNITDMNFSSRFWTDLEIKAHKMEVDSLTLSMKRNKNLERPPDVEKPLFKGMIDKIPYNVDLDSITISNSTIQYGELSVNKQSTGVIEINDINGSITKFSTFPERKEEFGAFETHLTAKLNNAAKMNIDLKVPYNTDAFQLQTTLANLNMTALSPSLIPLLGVEIKQGRLKRLDYHMNASYYQSQNTLVMDYEDLHLKVYKEDGHGSRDKNGVLSSIANAAIRHHNMPSKKGYQTANYVTQRNIYRSPFQHIVAGILDGAKHIVPAKIVQKLINKDNKKKKKH